GYSRAQALAEQAVLPVTFGALDGNASWLVPAVSNQVAVTGAVPEMSSWQQAGPHQLPGSYPRETTRPALFTALRTGFAEDLLRRAFEATRDLRAQRRAARPTANGGADHALRGLGKLLVVAPDQEQARRYLAVLRGWVPQKQAGTVRLATSDERDAHEALAAFRLRAEPSILVTVAMAYEGLDAPEVAVVAALTHIRSRPWLEQMIARATRVDPNAGSYEEQGALVFHPDDPLFATCRRRMETEQATLACKPKPARPQTDLPLWIRQHLAGQERAGIVPLESNALTLRLSTLRPGPGLILRRREQEEAAGSTMEPPSVAEHRLRQKVSELVAAQAIEDEGEMQAGGERHSLYHRYNATLKRVLGGKARREMGVAELEAAVAWLERNRLRDYLHVLEGDARYGWTARQRAGNWRPPVGRDRRSAAT
ncbi:MAG: restriction endonuclease subunit R, partial [Acetobacteraceae bacterium]|nr:restriction endonuclease subunit R [Acetobacteraceae bacterium]